MISDAHEEVGGEVTLIIEYQVDPHNADAFVQAMQPVREIRFRDGSTSWSIVLSLEDPNLHLEEFTVARGWSTSVNTSA